REGFEASSVQKLLDVTGINRGTLYNSFGDKDTFFKACLDHYNKLIAKDLDASLNNADLAPWAAIEKYFDLAVLAVSNKQRSMGCLLVNSLCESINYDKEIQKIVRNSFAVVRKALVKRLKDAEKDGKMKSGASVEFAADLLLNTLYGLRVNSRDAKPVKQLAEIVKFTVDSLK
ncbi:MAG: TetR/AcrR family transcriptional regulator, partial [Gammaproteobacteria bacterium]|nr:TetR/AcrR family transcriptional regulator [Gammaproteobacteria bacterium]